MNRITLRLIAVLAILTLCSVWAFGQTETGQVAGTVKDATGAVVVGAKVTIVSTTTGLTRTATTNSSGLYSVVSLPPGPYNVTIEGTGFQKATQSATVTVGAITNIDATLKVGA